MYFLYSFFVALALLLSAPVLLARRKYRAGLLERMGKVPERIRGNPGDPNIWIHAVSVGEVLAVVPLVAELKRRLPSSRIFVSTTTLTGQTLARQRFGERNVFYFPFDLPLCIAPYLRNVNPEMVVTAETEFWPNCLRLAKRRGARIALVNGRISDRSLPGYRRWRLFLRYALRNVELFLVQTAEDAKRLALIGAAPEKIEVSGNLKFDVAEPSDLPIVQALRNAFARGGSTSIFVCGSTVGSPTGKEAEEELLLKAFARVMQTQPSAVLVLAPRKPERFDEVVAIIERAGLPLWRRSLLSGNEAIAGGVVLLDSVGELASLYRLATIAFVGGSLVPAGGHNILEPAQAGVPIIVGKHTHNFRDIVETFRAADAVLVVRADAEALATIVIELIRNPQRRSLLAERAQQVFRSQAGATSRTAEALVRLLRARDRDGELRQAERVAP
jgi:3-deoxy-D-manno-octulosonic-acid transferase